MQESLSRSLNSKPHHAAPGTSPPRGKGEDKKGKLRDLNLRRLAVPRVDAIPLSHQVGRGELVLAKEKTSLLATEVGVRLESAIISKRVLVPGERAATTYMNGSETGPLPLEAVARRDGTQCPFFAIGTCKFGDACKDKHGGGSSRSPF